MVSKAWNFAHVLRDDGLSYMDYVEQITFLLFLKMADEQTKPPYNRKPIVPAGRDGVSLLANEGDDLGTWPPMALWLAMKAKTLTLAERRMDQWQGERLREKSCRLKLDRFQIVRARR